MSLINCPECGNECAADAISCPNCGHPFVKPVVQPKVVVRHVEREDSFPKWIFIPLGLLGVIILFVVFAMLRKDDDSAQRNINVNVATARTPVTTTTITPTQVQPQTIQPQTQTVIPTTSQPSTITTVPSTTTTTTVPAPTPDDKGTVGMEAKIINRRGGEEPVTKEKFYLLDRDLDSILAEANIRDDEGQGLTNAFGLSVVYPDKYRETNQKALAAIKRHIVYSTTTDGSGKASLKDVKPNSYYLFGIHKTGSGFAIWSSPVSVNPGQNSIVLSPITPVEVTNSNF